MLVGNKLLLNATYVSRPLALTYVLFIGYTVYTFYSKVVIKNNIENKNVLSATFLSSGSRFLGISVL